MDYKRGEKMKDFMAQVIEDKIRKRLMDLPDFVADYIYRLENVKEVQTMFEYIKDIQLFLEFLRKEKHYPYEHLKEIQLTDIKEVKERDVLDFLQYLKSYKKVYLSEKGKEVEKLYRNTDVSRSRKLATLHKFFTDLERMHLIENDPSKHLEIKINKKAKIRNRLSADEIDRFFSTIIQDCKIESTHQKAFHQKLKYRDYIITMILAFTGIRVSELVQLDIEDIQFGETNYLMAVRKGGDEQLLPLSEELAAKLKEYIERRKQIAGVPKEHQHALFLSLQKKRINQKTVRLMLGKYQELSNISIKITPHVFRRTFGTNHYNLYKDMYLTAQVMGHSSAETTRKFYADPSQERVIQSMKDFHYKRST